MTSDVANKLGRPGLPNRQGLYARVAKHATAAIDVLVDLLQCQNDNIRLGAAKTLLDKCLPDVKSVQILPDTEKSGPLVIVTHNGFIPPARTGN